MTSVDKLFLQFMKGLFCLLLLYGIGMILVIVLGKNDLAIKLINVWSTMFGACVGLGSGYLLGRVRSATEEEDERKRRSNGV
jgi:hypothetical protein